MKTSEEPHPVRVAARVTEECGRQLDELCRRLDRKQSWVVERAIREYFQRRSAEGGRHG